MHDHACMFCHDLKRSLLVMQWEGDIGMVAYVMLCAYPGYLWKNIMTRQRK